MLTIDKRIKYEVVIEEPYTDKNGAYIDDFGEKRIEVHCYYDKETMMIANNEMEVHICRYYETKEIYKWIDEQRDFNLMDSYVKNFSLSEYCKRKNLSSFQKIVLPNFDATNAFFDGNTDFSNAVFQDKGIFFNAQFGDGNVSFENAYFNGDNVSFESVEFGNGNISFSHSKFIEEKLGFSGSQYDEAKISFLGARFGVGNIDFSSVKFCDGDISFLSVVFNDGNVSFNGSQFNEGYLKFGGAIIDKISFVGIHFDSFVDFNVANCNSLDLSDTVIRDVFEISPEKLQNLNIDNMKIIGKMYLRWKENNLEQAINNQIHTTLKQKSEQFLILKENFKNIGRLDDEEKAYFEYRKHKMILDKKGGMNKVQNLKILLDEINRDEKLDRLENQVVDWKNIISKGETNFVEFKSSLRWDYKQKNVNKSLEYIVAKTISAFLNSKGGNLFIGVKDNGEILGLENDYNTFKKKNSDAFLLQIDQVIDKYLGKEFYQFITVKIEEIEEKDICIVNIDNSSKPVYMKNENEEKFFIRATASSQPMKMKEAHDYISMHWKK